MRFTRKEVNVMRRKLNVSRKTLDFTPKRYPKPNGYGKYA